MKTQAQTCIHALLLAVCTSGGAWAQSGSATDIDYKFTPSLYSNSDGSHASDINLRGTMDKQVLWLGSYQDNQAYSQLRTGYEFHHDSAWVRSIYSLQAAQRGFWGGSITSEVGSEKNYALLGFGRTNLKDYYNLNFDPNDAITVGMGTRAMARTELLAYHLWDDRLGTQQHVSHALARYHLGSEQYASLDLSYKQGRSTSNQMVHGHAWTGTYHFGVVFVRVARDAYVNFSDNTQTRVSLGMYF